METPNEKKPVSMNLDTMTDLSEVRFVLDTLTKSLQAGPKSRERSLVITKLQEAAMWAGEGLRLE